MIFDSPAYTKPIVKEHGLIGDPLFFSKGNPHV